MLLHVISKVHQCTAAKCWIHTLLSKHKLYVEWRFRQRIRLWLHSLFFKLTDDLLQLSLVLGKSCSQHHNHHAKNKTDAYQVPIEHVPQVYTASRSNRSSTSTHISQGCAHMSAG